MQRNQLLAHLQALGVDDTSRLDVNATITPGTLLAPAPQVLAPNTPDVAVAPSGIQLGPVPRMGLSGPGSNARESGPPMSGVFDRFAEPPDFEILSVIGEGGMGRVHLARQRSLGRDVAIKTLKAEVPDVHSVEALREEATTMGNLEHPNIVPVHAVGRDDAGRLLLVMKRVDGVAWSELLRDPRHPRWELLAPREEDRLEFHLSVLVQVANALQFAHSRGVIHLDVKPQNVLLGEHGEVYLSDWGIALRASGDTSWSLVGTPAYMAPEMLHADSTCIDARTDVFLLGATLHEVLTGVPPHLGANVCAVLMAAYDAAPPTYALEVPSELAGIARCAMARAPGDRFPTALAFRQALDERRRHAGALALIRTGRELLGELPAALHTSAGSEGDVDRKLIECRFAFVQALRIWPENEDARDGLEEALRWAVQHELDRENPDAVRGLLAELQTPDPALLARLAALETSLVARRAAVDKLAAIAADTDLRVGLRAITTLFWCVAATAFVLTIYDNVRARPNAAPPSHSEVIGVSLVMVAVVALGGLLMRKHLLANLAGRQTFARLSSGVLGLLAHRVIGAAHGVSAAAVLAMDFVVLGLSTSAAGLIVPRVRWALLVSAVGAVLAVVYPSDAVFIFSTFATLTLPAAALLWVSGVRASEQAGG